MGDTLGFVNSSTSTAAPQHGNGGGQYGAILLLVVGAVSLQTGAAFAAQIFPHFGSWGTTLLRSGIAAAVLFALFRPRFWRWNRMQWVTVFLFALTMAGMNGFFYAAIERIPLGIAVSIEFIGPLLLSALLSRSGRNLIWVGVAAAGMALLAVDSFHGVTSLDPLGVLYALIAAVFWGAYILAGSRAGKVVPGSGALAVALVIATIVTIPLGITGAVKIFAEPELIWLVLGMAVLASVVPYSFEFIALKRIPKPVFGVLTSLEPAVATLFGWLLLHQHAGWLQIAAVALVIVASTGTALGKRETVEVAVESLTTGPIELPVLPSQIGQQDALDEEGEDETDSQ